MIILIISVFSGLTTLMGAWFAVYGKKSNAMIVFGIGFSTAIMILVPFFELIPEALERSTYSRVGPAFLTGII